MVNEESDMGGRTWDCVCDVSVQIRCPHDSGVGICAWLCIYAFVIVWIVVYDVGGCHMSVVIDPGEVNCFCGCVMNFMMFLAYFQDNNQDIITRWNGRGGMSRSFNMLLHTFVGHETVEGLLFPRNPICSVGLQLRDGVRFDLSSRTACGIIRAHNLLNNLGRIDERRVG